MLLGFAGKIYAGKDEAAKMFQYLKLRELNNSLSDVSYETFRTWPGHYRGKYSGWEIHKYGHKLKQAGALLLGVPVDSFEDRDFKDSTLGEEWNAWNVGVFDINAGDYSDKPIKFSTEEGANRYAGLRQKSINKFSLQSAYKIDIESTPMTVREFMQKLGTEGLRDGLHGNTWVNALFVDYAVKQNKTDAKSLDELIMMGKTLVHCSYPNWLITDVRFLNEAKAIKDRDGYLVRINRICDPIGIKDSDAHISETELDDYSYDYVIENSGSFESLEEQTKKMMKLLNI